MSEELLAILVALVLLWQAMSLLTIMMSTTSKRVWDENIGVYQQDGELGAKYILRVWGAASLEVLLIYVAGVAVGLWGLKNALSFLFSRKNGGDSA